MSTTNTINLTQTNEQITFSATDNGESITLKLNELARGPAGGNSISTSTTTALNGLLKGNGTNVTVATAGTDYLEPNGYGTTVYFPGNAEQAAATPSYIGQLGFNSETGGLVVATSLTQGDWQNGFTFGTLIFGDAYGTGNLATNGTVSGSNITTGGNVTGNAATATALQTARSIGGSSFDGTADIEIARAKATSSAGGTLQNLSGTTCFSWGAGSGQNITIPTGTGVSFNSTSYTFGTGSAAAFNTALGLTTLATTTPGTGVATWLATPSSANLRAAMTDEVGTGALYFVGGALSTPASGTLTNCTGLPTTGITGAGDFLTIGPSEVSITGTTTLTSTAFGKQHVCSGTSADYAVTLPTVTSNAGRIISIRMSNALTKFVTITAAGAATIDGSATRIMWAQESCILYCDGTNWTKIGGKSRPMMCSGENGAGVSVTNNTITPISLATTINDGTGAMMDTVTSTKVIRIKRPGNYNVSCLVTLDRSGNFPGFEAYCAPLYNTLTAAFASWFTSPAFLSVVPTAYNGSSNSYAHITLSGTRRFNLSDYIALATYQTTGGTMTTRTSDIVRPNMALIEIPEW